MVTLNIKIRLLLKVDFTLFNETLSLIFPLKLHLCTNSRVYIILFLFLLQGGKI